MNSSARMRRLLQAGLVFAGAASGAALGAALTVLGKIVTGAPPATGSNYLWNMMVFGVVGAIVSPVVTWSGLRRVPLWQTVAAPLLAGIAAAALGVVIGSPILFLVLTPVAMAAAAFRLEYSHRDLAHPHPADALLASSNSDSSGSRG